MDCTKLTDEQIARVYKEYQSFKDSGVLPLEDSLIRELAYERNGKIAMPTEFLFICLEVFEEATRRWTDTVDTLQDLLKDVNDLDCTVSFPYEPEFAVDHNVVEAIANLHSKLRAMVSPSQNKTT